MKTQKIDESKLYIASAAPIIKTYHNNYYDSGEILDYFLVNPIIEQKSFLGNVISNKIVGYVEAISKIKICNTMYYYWDGILDDVINYDSVSHKITLGNVDWQVNSKNDANTVLTKEAIDEYLLHSKDEMIERINYVREYSKNVVKEDNIVRAIKRY